ncbi:MAG: DUF2460 domain-containing protein [Bryobacteraceae bacterium]
MADFPRLKTNSIAQYPLERTMAFSNVIHRFVDGSEQRVPRYRAPLRRWKIQLRLLDESEMTALAEFVEVQHGHSGVFSFTDPWDGTLYPNCSFEADQAIFHSVAVGRGETSLVVKENRAA